MKVVGIDVGLEKFAVVVYEDKKGSLILKKRGLKAVVFEGSGGVQDWIKKFGKVFEKMIDGVDLLIVEKPFGVMGRGTVLFELLGIVKYIAMKKKVKEVVEVPQKTLKKFATNKGNALKSDMVLRLYKEFGIDGLSEDEVDAVWLMWFGMVLARYRENRKLSVERFRKIVIKNFVEGRRR